MTVFESLTVALFCIIMVFAILTCLYLLIKLFSFGIGVIDRKSKKPDTAVIHTTANDKAEEAADFSSGELRLYNVDEPTAAMIMAIVSDESGIPLSELCFKSIKAIEQK